MKKETVDRIVQFVEERDWDQFHTPSNLAKSISIESGELLECFQWSETEYDIEAIKDELADVLVYCIELARKLHLEIDEIIDMKMVKNEAKYPVAKSYGKITKYTDL